MPIYDRDLEGPPAPGGFEPPPPEPTLTLRVVGESLAVRTEWGREGDLDMFSAAMGLLLTGQLNDMIVRSIGNAGREMGDGDRADAICRKLREATGGTQRRPAVDPSDVMKGLLK